MTAKFAPILRPAEREAVCRCCDKSIPKGTEMVSWYTQRNRGQNIHICTPCAAQIGVLAGGLPAGELRASLRHFLSAALLFGEGTPYKRTLDAFDEWFNLADPRKAVRDIPLPDGSVRHNVGSDNLSDEDRRAMRYTDEQVAALNADTAKWGPYRSPPVSHYDDGGASREWRNA